jgi:hypothetical protein
MRGGFHLSPIYYRPSASAARILIALDLSGRSPSWIKR